MSLNSLQMLPNFKNIFPELPDSSRVWLYLANRPMDDTELNFANEKLELFLSNWTAHNKKLQCAGTILFSQYLILSVNEAFENASGCSIDSSVRFVKALGQELGIDFFNRMIILEIDNESTRTLNYFEAINTQKTFLNPLIESLGQLRNDWFLNIR